MQHVEQKAMSPKIIKKINDAGVIAVLVIEELKHAVPLANALLSGGVEAIELTLRTPVALEAAEAIKNEVPRLTLGIGTVLTTEQVKLAAGLGADFAVAPGCNRSVIEAAQEHNLSFAPGIMTPSDIEAALEMGCRVLKYFPAESSGGMKHLNNIAAPYQHLGLKFIPLGGLTLENAGEYLKSPIVAAIGGSWIAQRNLIQAEDWDAITRSAKEICGLIKKFRP